MERGEKVGERGNKDTETEGADRGGEGKRRRRQANNQS